MGRNTINIEIEVTDKMLDDIATKILKKKESKRLLERIVKNIKQDVKQKQNITYTVEEVAKAVKQHKSTVLRHIKYDILKATKTGKSYIITEQNFKNYINGRNK